MYLDGNVLGVEQLHTYFGNHLNGKILVIKKLTFDAR